MPPNSLAIRMNSPLNTYSNCDNVQSNRVSERSDCDMPGERVVGKVMSEQ
jgi:hypothetical protein